MLGFYTLVGLGLSQFANHLANDINNSRYVKVTKNMYPSVRKQHSIYKGCIQVSVPFWLDLATSIDRLHFLRVRTIANQVSIKDSLALLLGTMFIGCLFRLICIDTSHSAYVATETELPGAMIDGSF